jgi:hypothetical protein
VNEAVHEEKAASDDPSDEQCDVGDVHDTSLQFKTPFQCDGVLRDIFRRDKLQIIWLVGFCHTETRTAVPTDLHGCNAVGIEVTHNSSAASWADFQSDEIAGFEDGSHCNPHHKSALF